jgi:ketosteroid isomerase-like protein
MKRIFAAAAVLAASTVAGCGSVGDRQQAASEVAVRLLSAVDRKDSAGACALLAPDTLAELEQSAGKSCAGAILDQDLPRPAAVTGARVYGQWAQVHLEDDTVFLAVFRGGWRVVAAGCRYQGDQPYDCTLQGG